MTLYTLGIDIGTSSVKTGCLNLETLKLSCVASRSYPNAPQQDPDQIWNAAVESIRETVDRFKAVDHIAAIGVSGQMHGTVLFGSKSEMLSPLINWQDRRCDLPLEKYGGRTTIQVMQERMELEELAALGVQTMASGFMGATLFYIKENDPDLFAKVSYVLFPTDMIRSRLIHSSASATDPTNAVGSGFYNARENHWQLPLIQKFDLPPEIFPGIHPTSQIAGEIAKEMAGLLGLRVGTPVIYGGGDLQMSVLGSGLVSSTSPVMLNIGSGSQVARIVPKYERNSCLDTWNFFDGMYVQVGASLGGGINYHRLRDKLREEEYSRINFQQMDEFAAKAVPGCKGLSFSSGPSRINPNRLSGFIGNLEYLKDPGYAARAVLEGVIYDLYQFFSQMEPRSQLGMVGSGKGLSKSRIWGQIAADMFNSSILITGQETALMGAAILAGVGAGEIRNIKEVVGKIEYDEIHPDQSSVDFYKDWFISRQVSG